MAEQIINFLAETTLNGAINSSQTTMVVTAVAASPTVPQFRVRIDNELILVTAQASSSSYTTIVRGIEGTTAASHASGARVYYVMTSAGLGGDRTFTSAITPLVVGGSGTTQTLTMRSTSGVGAAGADIIFQVGNAGATEAMRILNDGSVGIGLNNPTRRLHVYQSLDGGPGAEFQNPNTGTGAFATFKATSDTASINTMAHGSGRVATRYGVTLGSMAEVLGQTGNGLLIGTSTNATPIVFGTNGAERLRIDSAGGIGIGITGPTAAVHIKAGTATASTAPLKFTSGTNLTTGEAGAMEYDGTNLFFTRTGTTRESVICSNAVNSVSPTAPDRTITVVIAGTTYYLHAKTTND